jgi:hypothetical protein
LLSSSCFGRRLTLIDFSLDRRIFTQYTLAKELYDSFSADFRLSAWRPRCPTTPRFRGAKDRRDAEPQAFWKQGVHRGVVDIAAEALLTDVGGVGRIKSFGEFEQEYTSEGSPINKAFRRFDHFLLHFHPARRPVLWRMLIVHAHLYRAMLLTHEGPGGLTRGALTVPEADRVAYDWREPSRRSPDGVPDAVVREPFDVAERYLRERLGYLFGEPDSPRVTLSSVVARAEGSAAGRPD